MALQARRLSEGAQTNATLDRSLVIAGVLEVSAARGKQCSRKGELAKLDELHS